MSGPTHRPRRADVQGDLLDDALRAVVARHLEVPPSDLTLDYPIEGLVLDDARAARILGAVGDELEIRFPDDFLDGLDTYGQLHDAVRMAVGV
jgi:acyl carrier protein